MTASVSTRLVAVALLVSTSLFCSACRESAASSAPSPEDNHSSTEEATVEPQVDPFLVAYGKVLDNIGKYDFQVESDTASKSYGYTLVQVEGQKYPYLLVKQAMNESIDLVRIFAYDPKSQTVIAPDETFGIGVASAGGYRGDLSISNKHPHLEFMTTTAGTGQTDIIEIAVKDGELVKHTLVSGRFDLLDERDTSELTWADMENRSFLQGRSTQSGESKSNSGVKKATPQKATPRKVAPSKVGSSNGTGNSMSGQMQALIKQKKDAGMLVMEGTIRQFKAQELFKYQNGVDPTPGHKDNRLFTVLLLPSETEIELLSGDGLDTRIGQARMFSLENASDLKKFVGKKVVMAFDKQRTNWASDFSTPIGQPWSRGYEVLGVVGD